MDRQTERLVNKLLEAKTSTLTLEQRKAIQTLLSDKMKSTISDHSAQLLMRIIIFSIAELDPKQWANIAYEMRTQWPELRETIDTILG